MFMTAFVDIITEPKIVRTIHVLIITHKLWMGEGGGKGKEGHPLISMMHCLVAYIVILNCLFL